MLKRVAECWLEIFLFIVMGTGGTIFLGSSALIGTRHISKTLANPMVVISPGSTMAIIHEGRMGLPIKVYGYSVCPRDLMSGPSKDGCIILDRPQVDVEYAESGARVEETWKVIKEKGPLGLRTMLIRQDGSMVTQVQKHI